MSLVRAMWNVSIRGLGRRAVVLRVDLTDEASVTALDLRFAMRLGVWTCG